MISTTRLTPHLALATSALLVGCLSTRQHCVVNAGRTMLSDVAVTVGQRRFTHGYLPPGCHKSYSGSLELSRGDLVTIDWAGSQNEHHAVPVRLRQYPLGREVFFVIREAAVEVTYDPDKALLPSPGGK